MSYPIKYRERVLEYRGEGHTLEEAHKVFKVSVSTIRSWEQQMQKEGHLEKKKLNRTHRKIDPEVLKDYILKHPDSYQREIAEKFGCATSAVGKALKKLGITRKKRVSATKSKTRKK